MTSLKALACALALALFASAPPAALAATTVFDNGGATIPGSGGTYLPDNIAFDDFQLGQHAIIRGGTFDYDGFPTPFPTSLLFYVYSNMHFPSGGDQPGTQLASGVLTITSTTYLGDPGYIPHTRGFFDLSTPFSAQPGVRYWFGITSTAPEGPSWTVTDFHNSRTWQHYKFDDPGYYRVFDFERAFSLSAGVPEPSTWALSIMGLGLAGTALRRRRAIST